jgi:hypothetical protein
MAFFGPSPVTFPSSPYFGSDAFVSGLELNVVNLNQFTIAGGACRDLLSDYVISFDPVALGQEFLLCDVSTVGPGGCFPRNILTVSTQYNTTFCVYIIANKSGTTDGSKSGVVSPAIIVATGNEFLPPGYNAYRRIGYIYIKGSLTNSPPQPQGSILPWLQSGSGNERLYTLQTSRIRLSTSSVPTTYQPISLTAFQAGITPLKNNVVCTFTYRLSVNPAGDFLLFSADGVDAATSPSPFVIFVNNTSNSVQSAGVFTMPSTLTFNGTETSIYYKFASGGVGSALQVNQTGFYDSIGLSIF